MTRTAPERVEIVCPDCGLIAEVARPRGGARPKLCSCPAPVRITPVTRPRLCVSCHTKLNRYNLGVQCGPCRVSQRGWDGEGRPAGA